VQKRGATNVPFMVSSAATLDGDLFVIASTGNIGIGTALPPVGLAIGAGTPSWTGAMTAKNDAYVTGDVEVDGALYVDGLLFGDGSKLTGITGLISGLTQNSVSKANAAGTGLVDSAIYNLGSNVGINDTTPAAGLVVGSDATLTYPSSSSSAYVQSNLEVDGTIYGDGAGISNVAAGQITYDDIVYTTVKAALDHLLYVTPVISAFTNSVNAVEIGSTVSSTILNWTINKTITSQSLNQGFFVNDTATPEIYTDGASYTTDRTYTLTISDGQTNVNASSSVYFRNKRYWGVNASASLSDAQIIALSSELSTGRTQTRNGMAPAAQYIYIAYPASWGVATFTVNGLLNTDWTLSVQDHINASGNTTSYNVYRTNNLLTGSYNIVVN